MTLEQYGTSALQITAAAVMRAYLAYEAGQGSEVLRRYLTSGAAAALEGGMPNRDHAVAPSGIALGPYAVLRLDANRAYVCAGLLHPDRHDGVLAVELAHEGGRLLAARVGRATETMAPGRGAAPYPDPVGDSQPPPESPAHLRTVLGEFPDTPDGRHLWLLGAAIITTYRERYDLHHASLALGDPPEEVEQRTERDRAIAYLREITRDIARLEPDRPIDTPVKDASREQGLA
jgi:hypothetical protein